jgi:hypothetical protein
MHPDAAAPDAVGSVVLLLSPEGSSRARVTALGVEQQHATDRRALHPFRHGHLEWRGLAKRGMQNEARRRGVDLL